MSFTASDVIDSARDLHVSFAPSAQPDAVCVRFLNRYVRQLAGEVVKIRPVTMDTAAFGVPLPLGVFGAGMPVPSNLLVMECVVRRTGELGPTNDIPVQLLDASQRLTTNYTFPAAYLDGANVRLMGVEADWTPWGQFAVRYIPMPTVVSGSTTIPLPDDALPSCVFHLADFMAHRRDGIDGNAKVSLYANDAADAQRDFLDRLMRQLAAEVGQVQDVYGDNGGW